MYIHPGILAHPDLSLDLTLWTLMRLAASSGRVLCFGGLSQVQRPESIGLVLGFAPFLLSSFSTLASKGSHELLESVWAQGEVRPSQAGPAPRARCFLALDFTVVVPPNGGFGY